jgi:NAD(P)-dependent dehydrogenase (short-subunit alcohol dehydrogenase family)
VLVNNAGYSQSGPVEEVSPADARRQFETNLFGPARLTQLVLPGMRAQGWGKVVNISSMGGRLTFPGGGWYHASKYALEALSDALRFEVAGFGVDVVLVEPGFIRTGFSAAAAIPVGDSDDPYAAFIAGLVRSTREVYRRGLLSRLAGEPDDVAATVLAAVTAAKPKARYPVTASARVLHALRVVLSDQGWDAVMARQFVRPGQIDG